MNSLITDVKKAVLNCVYERGSKGASESEVFSILYDFDREHGIFGYGVDTTPESLVESLISKGLIVRNCMDGLVECKFFSPQVYATA
jgi:hypothetical protein